MGRMASKGRARRESTSSVNDTLPAVARRLIRDIQHALSVDLLAQAYRGFAEPTDHYVRGHCYIATEAFYYLFGKREGYRPHFVSTGKGVTHWWLQHPTLGSVADPTAQQVTEDFDYSIGQRKWFRNPSPNRRTRELMRRVRARQAKVY
jgi:hypothetical protein